MLKGLKIIDLFAGIGGIRIPFQEMNAECVFSSEIDKHACATYQANFGEYPYGDITKIKASDIPDHDILLAGFPCQAFSIIGKMNGFEDTRGTLFFDIERIMRVKKPEAFLLENVKQLATHDGGRTFAVILDTLRKLGYFVHWKVLNALDYGLPQKRERTIIVGFKNNYKFKFPSPLSCYKSLAEILEPDDSVDLSYFASEKIVDSRLKSIKIDPFYPSIWHENKGGNVSIRPYACALRANASYNYLLVNGKRRLTSRELLRLQGFPDDFKIIVSHAEIRKQAGNSVPVNMIRAVAQQMAVSLNSRVLEKDALINCNQISMFELHERPEGVING